MATEYRLSYTAEEINEKLGKIDSLGSGGFSEIICVKELPTENINTSAIYRVDNINIYMDLNENPQYSDFNLHHVDKLPETGEPVCQAIETTWGGFEAGQTWHCYFSYKDNDFFGYVTEDTNALSEWNSGTTLDYGWNSFYHILTKISAWPINKVYSREEFKSPIQMNLFIQTGLYYYADGKWEIFKILPQHEHNEYINNLNSCYNELYNFAYEINEKIESRWGETLLAQGYLPYSNENPVTSFRIDTGLTWDSLKNYKRFAIIMCSWANIPFDGCNFIFNTPDFSGDDRCLIEFKTSQIAFFEWGGGGAALRYIGGSALDNFQDYMDYEAWQTGLQLSYYRTPYLNNEDKASAALILTPCYNGIYGVSPTLYVNYNGEGVPEQCRWMIWGIEQ